MSGTWQTFLEKLSEGTESEKGWKTEICDCKDGKNQLFYHCNDKSFSTAGECNQSSFCAQIMKDKHLAKIDSRMYQKQKNYLKKKRKRVERKYSRMTACKPAARSSRKSEFEEKPAISFEALTTFFDT
ncbi:MAG: hypothetical protein ACTSRU_08000 [Candidatus Hodarchaeales archaeon]